MRHIVCRFKDEAHFFRHLTRSTLRGPRDTLAFLGDFQATAGDEVRLTLVISNHAERYDVIMKVTNQRPSALGEAGADMWRYQAVVTERDSVWLKMFASKLTTMQRMQESRALFAA
ncbi:MAG: hypothetical protein ACNA8W_17390 [Bradymonadaceae bacterium]